MTGGFNYTGLFGRGNAFCGTAVFIGFTVSDFDKNQTISMLHDQVDFTGFTVIVAADG